MKNGINLNNWTSQFHYAEKSSLKGFFNKVIELEFTQ